MARTLLRRRNTSRYLPDAPSDYLVFIHNAARNRVLRTQFGLRVNSAVPRAHLGYAPAFQAKIATHSEES